MKPLTSYDKFLVIESARKMKMEGEIVSRESIKPCSPTPENKKIYKLSLFDQIVPPIFVPLVLYFPPSNTTHSFAISQTTQKLKLSLSSTLSHFYPLAGRIRDSLSIDCNDEGVLFIVARFDYNLSDFLRNPNPIACRAHIPSQLSWAEPGPGSHVAMVQVNHFACGGVAIGSLFLHKVVDGVTIGTFMKAWGTTTREAGEALFFPDYSAQCHFPQNESMQRESHLFSAMRQYFKFGKTVMRRYVFDSSAISTLRAEICSQDQGMKRGPTRVETVSAFLWKCFMVASQNSSDYSTSVVTHGVNMRRKAQTPFPDQSFGNYVWLVPASTENNSEDNRDLSHLFCKVRKAISKVDVEFVKRMEGEQGFSGYCKNLEETWSEFPEEANYLAISSWCNFGLYSVDFGWGRPAWMSKCDGGSDVEWPFINVLWLMDTRDGGGIEAWLTLDEHIFSEFCQIKELHDLALVDPSPLPIMEDSDPFKKPVDHDLDAFKKSVLDLTLVDPSPLEIIKDIADPLINKSVLTN